MIDTVIRPALRDDLPGVLALYRHLNPRDPPLDAAKAEAAWLALVGSPGNTVFVADASGTLVAVCALSVTPNLTGGPDRTQ